MEENEYMSDGWMDEWQLYGRNMDVNLNECWMNGMTKVIMDELCI